MGSVETSGIKKVVSIFGAVSLVLLTTLTDLPLLIGSVGTIAGLATLLLLREPQRIVKGDRSSKEASNHAIDRLMVNPLLATKTSTEVRVQGSTSLRFLRRLTGKKHCQQILPSPSSQRISFPVAGPSVSGRPQTLDVRSLAKTSGWASPLSSQQNTRSGPSFVNRPPRPSQKNTRFRPSFVNRPPKRLPQNQIVRTPEGVVALFPGSRPVTPPSIPARAA